MPPPQSQEMWPLCQNDRQLEPSAHCSPLLVAAWLTPRARYSHLLLCHHRAKQRERRGRVDLDLDRLPDEPFVGVEYDDVIGHRAAGQLLWPGALGFHADFARTLD